MSAAKDLSTPVPRPEILRLWDEATWPSYPAGRLVAVVVTHNRLDQLRKTVLAYLGNDIEALVVVNNGSTDGTAEWLDGLLDPRVDIAQSATNLGGAGGFAFGMAQAMRHHRPDWIVVSDDDGRPAPGTLRRFLEVPRDEADIWLAAVHAPSGEVCDMNRPGRNPFGSWGAFWRTLRRGRAGFHLSDSQIDGDATQQVDQGFFVGMFISARAIARTGYPDPALFIYGDDVLYSLAVSQSGGCVTFDPALRYVHDFGSYAEGGRRMQPLWKIYYHHRNLMLVSGPLFWPVMALMAPKWLLKLRHYHGQRQSFLRLLRRAMVDGAGGSLCNARGHFGAGRSLGSIDVQVSQIV